MPLGSQAFVLFLACLVHITLGGSSSYIWNTEIVVNVTLTNPNIADNFGPHEVFVNASAPTNTNLFVFLPATFTWFVTLKTPQLLTG